MVRVLGMMCPNPWHDAASAADRRGAHAPLPGEFGTTDDDGRGWFSSVWYERDGEGRVTTTPPADRPTSSRAFLPHPTATLLHAAPLPSRNRKGLAGAVLLRGWLLAGFFRVFGLGTILPYGIYEKELRW